jgi:hypothetical protein
MAAATLASRAQGALLAEARLRQQYVPLCQQLLKP